MNRGQRNPEMEQSIQICDVCFRHCRLSEGQAGFCRSRKNIHGEIRPLNYGKITGFALDPVEKKPLNRFYPGSMILSVGSFGCNLRCPFCQNHEIAQTGANSVRTMDLMPEQLADLAEQYRQHGNLGVAYTYNEPLIGWEYVRDTAMLVREKGMKNVLVTNGTADLAVLEELLPYIDAMNIDLKGIRPEYYSEFLGGNLDMVLAFIRRSVELCHVELTTLIIPGFNDSEEEMREMAGWIAGLNGGSGSEIPYHISRYFPRYLMKEPQATPVSRIYHLAETARKELKYVYTGNC